MGLLDLLADQKIAAALEAGEFDDLPGQGRPLDLDDDALVPEDVRVAYRILKNAGFVPPELDSRREAVERPRGPLQPFRIGTGGEGPAGGATRH